MRRSCRLAAVLAFLVPLILTGCAAEKLIKEGDAFMASNQAIEAEARYEQAQVKKPKLAGDEKFMAKLTRARCLAAYQRGERLARDGQWERAVAEFEQSIRIGPEAVDAPRALAEAKRQAARQRHQVALAAADKGKLDAAVLELRRALELDPECADARDALNSVEGRKEGRLAQAEALYQQALAEQGERNWLQAVDTLNRALAADGNHLPARARLLVSNERLAEARTWRSTGRRRLGERELDASIAAYEKALEVWPFYDDARREIEEPRRQRAVAQEHYNRAAQFATAGQWPEAMQAAQAALGVYPNYRDAQGLVEQARREAAAGYVRTGNTLLAQGKVDAAEVEFKKALDYVADFLAAKEGLGVVARTRGDAARQQGLWGNALLWYMDAADQVDRPEYRDLIRQARAAVNDRVRFSMSIAAGDVPAVGEPSTAALVAAAVREVVAAKPAALDLLDPGAGAAMYRVRLDLSRVDVAERRVGVENRQHHYIVRQEVVNPELEDLRHRLNRERRELNDMLADHGRLCPPCHGTGQVSCPTCRGRGVIGGAACRTCRGTGRVTCHDCQGRGRPSHVTQFDIDRKRAEVDRLERRLRDTPPTVLVDVGTDWPYVVETYEKVGKMVASLQVVGADGRIVHSDVVETQAVNKDETTRNANAAIGLPEDPLVLPTDAEVRAALLQGTATETAKRLIAAVVQQRVDQAQRRGEALGREGKQAEAVEAYVDAALLAEPLNPEESARVLKELRQKP